MADTPVTMDRTQHPALDALRRSGIRLDHRCAAAVTVAVVLAAGCGAPAAMTPQDDTGSPTRIVTSDDGFHGTVVNPVISLPPLLLRDTTGREFDLMDRPADEVTALFFGFTNCDDVCPTTMADLAAARRSLPPQIRQHVKVIFVTEDPQRDTPRLLRGWLDRFDPTFVGLIGGNAHSRSIQRQLHLPVSRIPDDEQDEAIEGHPGTGGERDYEVEHSGIVYVFGTAGRVVIYTGGYTPSRYAADFARLAAS